MIVEQRSSFEIIINLAERSRLLGRPSAACRGPRRSTVHTGQLPAYEDRLFRPATEYNATWERLGADCCPAEKAGSARLVATYLSLAIILTPISFLAVHSSLVGHPVIRRSNRARAGQPRAAKCYMPPQEWQGSS